MNDSGFFIEKDLGGAGYFVMDGPFIVVAYRLTLWGAKRALARAKKASEWNKQQQHAREVSRCTTHPVAAWSDAQMTPRVVGRDKASSSSSPLMRGPR